MSVFIIGLAWLSVAIFSGMVLFKFVKFSSMPLHLRWELCPVDHETREKRSYGGSYLEEVDWFKRPAHKSLMGELIGMGSEIFFLHRVKEHNPYKIWLFSMSMHWGIYFLFTWIFLLVVESIIQFDALSQITNILGVVAFTLGAFGCLMLAVKRATNRGLNLYSAPVDYFNLLFLFSIFVTGLLSWFMDSSLTSHREYLKGIISFKAASVPTITVLNFILFELFLIYMPFTKLFHYIAKYFTFHKVLWDDAFKVKGSPEDKKIMEQLSSRVTWAGPHIVPGKTWLEEAEIIDGGEKK